MYVEITVHDPKRPAWAHHLRDRPSMNAVKEWVRQWGRAHGRGVNRMWTMDVDNEEISRFGVSMIHAVDYTVWALTWDAWLAEKILVKDIWAWDTLEVEWKIVSAQWSGPEGSQ